MMKKTFLATVVSTCIAACGGGAAAEPVERQSGMLSMVPSAFNFDFVKLDIGHLPRSELAGWKTRKLEAKFRWEGTPGVMTLPQHTVLMYGQGMATNRPVNLNGDILFTHGAGVIATEKGLGLELWFLNPVNGSYDDGTPDAYVWYQTDGRCMQAVQGGVPPGTLCLLSEETQDGAYMTASPDFQLTRGQTYIMRMSLTPAQDGWVILEGQLWEERANRGGMVEVLVQKARVGFQYTTFFPDANQNIVPYFARTPGNPTEQYVRYLVSTGGF